MLHEIKINFVDVSNDVGRLSANIGASSADGEGNPLYDFVATTKYDADLLRKFWWAALPSLTQVFHQFLACTVEEGDTRIYQLNLPGNFNLNVLDSLRTTAHEFMVNSLLAAWCGIKAKSEQEQYAQKAAANMLDIYSKLYTRRPPIRLKPR